jgi:integrase
MSPLRDALDDYLRIRRALGFKLSDHGYVLPNLVDDLERAGATTLTTELALAWAVKPTDVHPFRWRQRLSIARGFARYLQTLDPGTEVPARDLLPHPRRRVIARLYSPEQLAALVAAAGALARPLRAATYGTLFGLLAVSGMRVGEALRLNVDDIDLDEGLLVVRKTKFNKSRALPLHPTTTAALRDYSKRRKRLCQRPTGPSFFVSRTGTRLLYVHVREQFIELADQVGMQPRPGERHARLHDVRHSFAVNTLLDWYRADVNVAARLPLLSAYLGHSEPASTYWYLQAAPELLALASDRLEHRYGGQA